MSEPEIHPLTANMVNVGITTGALFDMREADNIYRTKGLRAYIDHMQATKDIPLRPGHAFNFVASASRINRDIGDAFISFRILSRNDIAAAERVANSLNYYKLQTSGALYNVPPVPFLKDTNIDWFITTNPEDAAQALANGIAACSIDSPLSNTKITLAFNRHGNAKRIGLELPRYCEDETLLGQPRIHMVYDLDQTALNGESDAVARTQGVQKYFKHETEKFDVLIGEGPFFKIASKFSRCIEHFEKDGGKSPLIHSVATIRGGAGSLRAVKTVNGHHLRINGAFMALGCGLPREGEISFVNPLQKDGPIKTLITLPEYQDAAALFLDDSASTIEKTKKVCPSGLVPGMGAVSWGTQPK
ncbi:MAG: hypothetical protein GC136_01370 [Alphaproteobacteria bacterium]|nr:hypothetical protein [Alphaproteobacteria bacterium]